MDATQTAGQQFTAELRRYFHVGTRTRWGRKNGIGVRLDRVDLLDQIRFALTNPGAYGERFTEACAPSFTAVNAWFKHIESARSDAALCAKLKGMTPWQFTAYLGRMVDSGCTNVGEFEIWFGNERTRVPSLAVAA